MEYPKITIITPNFNGKKFLERTILSVLSQNYPKLEYIIIDGGSNDGSIDIIKKYEKKLSYWLSEPDKGIYFALQKGFYRSTGDIMGWINSDDILHPNALLSVARIFESNPHANWIQGWPTVINENNELIFDRAPRYKKEMFLLKRYHDWSFIQQESTFWKRNLWLQSGAFISTKYNFAGDFELWIRFFKYSKMYVVNEKLGAFRLRSGQISNVNSLLYMKECDQIINSYIKSIGILQKLILYFFLWLEPKIKTFSKLYSKINYYKEVDKTLVLK